MTETPTDTGVADRNTTPTTTEETTELPRELKVDSDKLATEVAWLAKMPTTEPVTAVIEVTSLLSAVMVRRTCFERYQESIVPAVGIAQASILVDAAKLAAALKTVSGQVVITIEDGQLRIKDAQRTVRLKTADEAVAFPPWPAFQGQGRTVVTTSEMRQALTSVGSNTEFPQLMTVQFDDGKMVTTDRFRLSAITYSQTGFVGTVPAAVLRQFSKNESAVFVEAGTVPGDSDDWVELRSGMRTVTAPLPQVEFPKWRALVPADPLIKVLVPRTALIEAISGEEVNLSVDGEVLTVLSGSEGIESEQQIKLFQTLRNDTEEPMAVSMRSKYAKDALHALSGGLVVFEATGPRKAVTFRDISEKDLHLVMPAPRAG